MENIGGANSAMPAKGEVGWDIRKSDRFTQELAAKAA